MEKQRKESIVGVCKSLLNKNNNLIFWAAMFILPLVWVYTPDYFRSEAIPSFWEYIWLRRNMAGLSYVILLLLFFVLTIVVRRISISSLILSSLVVSAGIANYFKILYRKNPVVPLDILQIKDALTVTKNDMPIFLTKEMIIMIVLLVLAVLFLWFIRLPDFFTKGTCLKKWIINCLAVVLCGSSSFLFLTNVLQNETLMVSLGYEGGADTVKNSYFSTFFTNFFFMTRYVSPAAPSGYSRAEMERIADEISAVCLDEQSEPDVILVVAESWHMLDNYNVSLSQNPFENYRELAEEGTSGYIFSPYYGGGTANVEFELLTGLPASVGNLSSTVFNSSLYPHFPSLSDYYQDIGYTTIALHAHTSSLYNRINAYSNLGFDQSYFSDSFEDPIYSGSYINDLSCVNKVIDLYEEAAASDQPVFIHALTMEGHLNYDPERIEAEDHVITIVDGNYSNEQMETIATAATIYGNTDRAVGVLADYFRDCNRDVILIVVGDHQTPLSRSDNAPGVLEQVGIYDTLDYIDVRKTPYLVWTNFDSELPDTFGTLPHNMLLPTVLNSLDTSRPAYFDYLLQSMVALNGVDSGYLIDVNGNLCDNPNAEQIREAEERELVRYDIVSGKHYLKDVLY